MPSPFRRPRFQFSLKTLLATTLVFGALLGWLSIKIEKARRQQAAVAAIGRLGGTVEYYGYWTNDPPSFLEQTLSSLGRRFRSQHAPGFCQVVLPAKRADAVECLKLCTKIDRLQLLNLGHIHLEAGDLADIERLTELRTLAISSAPVGDDILAIAGELPKLGVLQLINAAPSDAGLRKLAKAKHLVMLVIIGSPGIGDSGLAELGALDKLEILTLEGASVTDAGLVHLEKLANLQKLNLRGTPVTEAGIGKLRNALPDCEIIGP
jgi:hypothetical protein